ncbi:hypothetical protein B0H16DRAFT_1717860 [Mycena metata]|uniref:Uncharacterized protein n=1 Tax=Mycena metata TaxID=1033252 RepID=A0AAD7NKT3_9AGAR|nr:hypothetical protein B0H16DRAFT_1717860 [Mycena metata]
MNIYTAGSQFAAVLMRNSLPLDNLTPEELAGLLIVDGILFPCPIPTLDSDEAWCTAALLKVRAYLQSLRFAWALLDTDTEARSSLIVPRTTKFLWSLEDALPASLPSSVPA